MTGQLRSIARQYPRFKPAWKQLLMAQMTVVDVARYRGGRAASIKQLRADVEGARSVFPDLAQATLADASLLPKGNYADELRLFRKAAEQAPDDPTIVAELMQPSMRVGRMTDAVVAARKAVQFDPLSAYAQTQLILMLAYAGQIDAAQTELAKSERRWPGSGTVKDAQWAFHLRFGDPKLALALSPENDPATRTFLEARSNPSVGNVARVVASFRPVKPSPTSEEMSFAIQALGEFNQVDDVFAWIARTPTGEVADSSYILFRPALASARRNPRFIAVARRVGLLKFWRESGEWPDFCNERGMPYDCKTEASKYAL